MKIHRHISTKSIVTLSLNHHLDIACIVSLHVGTRCKVEYRFSELDLLRRDVHGETLVIERGCL